ncbi:MAG: pirin family protein [Nitrososphaeraceae archaeon]|jgi:redox-sensitive bicupin YhaK (pirin superfamily)
MTIKIGDANHHFLNRSKVEHYNSRSVSRIINSTKTTEGGGFIVSRPFPTNTLLDFDPFLLLDEMGPKNWKPGEAKGAPDHPHRGFETVTYMLEGRFEHKDSRGNSGKLGPGDVQWMTAGAGVVHSEMPEKEFLRSGGNLHGFQLWVNLPQRDKMIKPRYQDVPSSKIPVARTEDGAVKVKIIAGEAFGARAIIQTMTPIFYLHFTLQPGAKVVQPVSKEYNSFAYIINGEALIGPAEKQKIAKAGQMIIFKDDGEEVEISAPADSITTTNNSALDILLIGGLPLNEPVARYGPFVMNTKEEILKAIEDYQNGNMGEIAIR